MTADFCYKIVQDILAKNQNGYLDPDQFNRFFQQANISFMDFLLGEFRDYVPGRAVAKVEVGMNQIIRQRLAPFIDEPYALTIDSAGRCSYPPEYEQVDAVFYGSKMKRVRWVSQDCLYSFFDSDIDPVEDNPIYLIDKKGFQFYPVGLSEVKISYVRKPLQPKWAYTTDAVTGLPVQDEGASVDPEWNDVDMFEIIARILSMAGVSLQAGQVSQFANEIKYRGQ